MAIEKGDIVWLDPEAGGANPSGAVWWLPGQERYQWVVTDYSSRTKTRKRKYPWAKVARLDNGLPVFDKRDRGLPSNRWIDTRWLRKDEFLSAVKQAKTKHNKGENNHG